MENYEKIEKIGEGSYGKVYKAHDLKNKRLVAIKKTPVETAYEGVPSTTLREVSLLQMLSESNHIVKLLTVEYVEERQKSSLYLVFEYMTTDLKKWLEHYGRRPVNPITEDVIQSMTYQLMKGIAHCHKHGVMHRDLKPQNLLVDENSCILYLSCLKIADFGLGRAFSIPIRSYTHEIVTLWYRAPEVLLGVKRYGLGVDIWACGCIFAEMIKMAPLFKGDSEIQHLLQIFKIFGTPNEDKWPGLKNLRDWHEFPQWTHQDLSKVFPTLEQPGLDLLKCMLIYDPVKRISAKDTLSHPYFNDLDKKKLDQLEISNPRPFR